MAAPATTDFQSASATHRKRAAAPLPTVIRAREDVYPVRAVAVSDLIEALRAGFADFMAKPSHIVFLGVIYPIVGVLLAQLSIGASALPLFFPLLAGFALIGPFAGIGLYEISKRREQGKTPSWNDALAVFDSKSIKSILGLGALLFAVFGLWLISAMLLYNWLFASQNPENIGEFLSLLFTTGSGWALIILGHLIGFVFAVGVLMISAVSFPLLLDQHTRAAVAMRTSVRAVLSNPFTFAVWGAIIAAALMIGAALLFVGLAIVIPVLAHASWHVYRKTVVT
jgi:uncharacterized membrane protein